nr:uncharacterized protein LOC109181091 [Ipomoea batatas]
MSLLHSFLFLRKMPALILTEVRGQAAELRKEQVKEAKKKCYRCICSHLMIFTSTKTDCLSTKCTLGSSQLEFLHPSLISSDFRMGVERLGLKPFGFGTGLVLERGNAWGKGFLWFKTQSSVHWNFLGPKEIVRIETYCLDRPDFGLANARILLDRLISNFRDLEAGEDHRRPTERPPLELIRARIGEVVSLEGGSCLGGANPISGTMEEMNALGENMGEARDDGIGVERVEGENETLNNKGMPTVCGNTPVTETETEIVEEAVSKVKGKKVVSVVGNKGEDRAEKLAGERVGDDVSKVAGVVNFSGNQQQEKGNFNTLCANMQQMVIKARESEQCVKPKGKENGDMATGKFLTQFTKAMTALIQDSIEKKERKGKEGGAKSSVSAQARVKDVSEGSSKGERVFKNTMDLVKVVEEFMKKDKVLDEKVKEALKEVNTYLWTVYDKEKEEYIEEGINRAMRAATIFLVKVKHCPSWGSENGLFGRYLKANIDSVGARIAIGPCHWICKRNGRQWGSRAASKRLLMGRMAWLVLLTLQGPTGPKFVFACGSGAGNAKSQPSSPIPTPQSQVVRQPIAQGQGASTGAKELTQPAQGASEAPFNFNFDINMQGLNAKQRKRLRCKLKKQKGKSVVVDKSPEVGTSGAQPELSTGGTEGLLPDPAGKLPPIPEGSEMTPAPTSSIQTDLDQPQQVLFSFTPLNPARFMGPLEIGMHPCTPPSDRDSGDTQKNSPVVPGGPRRTGGRSYSDSDVPREGQEASLGGSRFDTDQEPHPDHHFRPALILRDSFVKGAPPSAHHVPGSGGYS